HARF
ncbi:hypothetical protein D030_2694B, partial [Vibrio parahaemolyticus AQ3810]